MGMRRAGLLCVFAALLAAFVLSSCSGDSPTKPAAQSGEIDTTGQFDSTDQIGDTISAPADTTDQTGDTTGVVADTVIDWVSTEVLYNQSLQEHDLSLLFIMVDWCPHCQNLKKYTLTDSTVIATINSSFNASKIDGDSDSLVVYFDMVITEHDMAFTGYHLKGYPTIVVLDTEGHEITRFVGERSAEVFVSELNSVLESN